MFVELMLGLIAVEGIIIYKALKLQPSEIFPKDPKMEELREKISKEALKVSVPKYLYVNEDLHDEIADDFRCLDGKYWLGLELKTWDKKDWKVV